LEKMIVNCSKKRKKHSKIKFWHEEEIVYQSLNSQKDEISQIIDLSFALDRTYKSTFPRREIIIIHSMISDKVNRNKCSLCVRKSQAEDNNLKIHHEIQCISIINQIIFEKFIRMISKHFKSMIYDCFMLKDLE
jgi:hypothetical protein